MPSSSSSSSSSAPQKTPTSSNIELKPISICVPSNTEMSGASTTLSTTRSTPSVTNANFYHSGGTPSSTTSTGNQIAVGALSVMVARFAGVDTNSRPPTVILQRPAITATTRANVVVSTGSAMRTSIGAHSTPSS